MAEIHSDQSEGVQKPTARLMDNTLQDQEKGFHALPKNNHINLKNCKQCSNMSTLQDVTSLMDTANHLVVFITQLTESWDCFTSHHYEISDAD